MRRLEARPTLLVTALLIALAGCTAGNGDPETTPQGGSSAGTAPSTAVATEGEPPPAGDTATAATGVTVTGSGVASGAPDVARITVGVEVQREAVQAALDEANAATEDVLAALDEAGIAEEDRQTRDFGIQPMMDHRSEGSPTITGYSVRNLIEVTVRDVDRLGEVIEQAVAAAGDHARVHGVSFALEADDDLVAAAREAAMADARAQAEHYAELAGGELGPLIGIQDQTTSSPRRASEDMAAEAGGSAVPIAPGEQDVVVRVTARWSLN